jgi:hypothetical protein
MAHPIIRCYDSVRQTAGLDAELKQSGFAGSQILPNATIASSSGAEFLTAALAQLGIARPQAASLAALIRQGGAVAVVPAAFGTGANATQILSKYNPTAESVRSDFGSWDDAAPFSSLLHVPVLADCSKPFQGSSGTPLIIQQKGEYSSMSGTPLLIKQNGSYQSFSGTPLLVKDGPYKSLSGTPLLLEQKGEYRSYSGTPLLLKNATPFSSMLGWPTLLK